MPGPMANLGVIAGVIVSLGVGPLPGQQQVLVTVAAVPNPVLPGGCTRIQADVRDELNRPLSLENGVPLQWSSYDYSTSNGTDFEWRGTVSGEFELCAKAGVSVANTQVTATIKGMPYSGTTILTVAASAPGTAPVAAATPPVSAPTPPTQANVPAQPYAPPAQPYAPPAQPSPDPAQPYGPPAQPSAAPAQPYAPPAQTYEPPPQVAAAPPATAAPAPPAVAQTPVKSGGGFLKKIGGHIKQRAAEVKTQTTQNLAAAATQVVDTAFQTGSGLVSSTTAEVTNTARMGIGGVGRQLMLVPQRGGANADNLTLAISSGRAVLLEMRFSPGTDVLEPSARELVRRLAVELRTAMATAPNTMFEIEGHVDSVPNAQVLSEYRAAAVKAALSSAGVDGKRMTALGYGTSRPMPSANGLPVPTARIEVQRCNDGQRACLMGSATQ